MLMDSINAESAKTFVQPPVNIFVYFLTKLWILPSSDLAVSYEKHEGTVCWFPEDPPTQGLRNRNASWWEVRPLFLSRR